VLALEMFQFQEKILSSRAVQLHIARSWNCGASASKNTGFHCCRIQSDQIKYLL